jgi:hypothetical protein
MERFMTENIRFLGRVKVWKNDHLIRAGQNMVVQGGLNIFAGLIGGLGTPTMQKMAVGDSSVLPAINQTALQGVEGQRLVAAVAVTGSQVDVSATFPSDGSRLVDMFAREFGIFASDNTMVSRWTCQEFSLLRTDSLDVVWTIIPTQG